MSATLAFTLSKNHTEIIKAVLYFNVFNYPLSVQELYENSAVVLSRDAFDNLLDELLVNGLLKKKDGFVFGIHASEKDIAKRINGNKGAEAIMPTAYRYSQKIASFPFVEGVFLSGALSKKYYDDKGDIDFFIVTQPNRLWICRTLVILRYKFLSKSKKKYWCTNYFVASDSMALTDINAFTGTELAYLIPTVNYALYKNILRENSWYKKRFPNKLQAPDAHCVNASTGFLKTVLEKLFSGAFGKWIDDTLLSVTLKHWQKKYPEMAEEDFELQFRSRKNVCKRHDKGFQNKILRLWEEKQSDYEKAFNVLLK